MIRNLLSRVVALNSPATSALGGIITTRCYGMIVSFHNFQY